MALVQGPRDVGEIDRMERGVAKRGAVSAIAYAHLAKETKKDKRRIVLPVNLSIGRLTIDTVTCPQIQSHNISWL